MNTRNPLSTAQVDLSKYPYTIEVVELKRGLWDPNLRSGYPGSDEKDEKTISCTFKGSLTNGGLLFSMVDRFNKVLLKLFLKRNFLERELPSILFENGLIEFSENFEFFVERTELAALLKSLEDKSHSKKLTNSEKTLLDFIVSCGTLAIIRSEEAEKFNLFLKRKLEQEIKGSSSQEFQILEQSFKLDKKFFFIESRHSFDAIENRRFYIISSPNTIYSEYEPTYLERLKSISIDQILLKNLYFEDDSRLERLIKSGIFHKFDVSQSKFHLYLKALKDINRYSAISAFSLLRGIEIIQDLELISEIVPSSGNPKDLLETLIKESLYFSILRVPGNAYIRECPAYNLISEVLNFSYYIKWNKFNFKGPSFDLKNLFAFYRSNLNEFSTLVQSHKAFQYFLDKYKAELTGHSFQNIANIFLSKLKESQSFYSFYQG